MLGDGELMYPAPSSFTSPIQKDLAKLTLGTSSWEVCLVGKAMTERVDGVTIAIKGISLVRCRRVSHRLTMISTSKMAHTKRRSPGQ